MRCPWRPLRAGKTRNGRWLVRAVFLCLVLGPLLGFAAASPAHAQFAAVAPIAPIPTPPMINSTVSSGATVTNLGSNFLERLGTTSGFSRMLRTNPGRRRCLGNHGSAALPDLVRGLRHYSDQRPARPVCRRQPQDLGRRRRYRRAASRPASMSASPSTRAAPPSTCRWRCNRRPSI